jgi:hypothetical protein
MLKAIFQTLFFSSIHIKFGDTFSIQNSDWPTWTIKKNKKIMFFLIIKISNGFSNVKNRKKLLLW